MTGHKALSDLRLYDKESGTDTGRVRSIEVGGITGAADMSEARRRDNIS